MKNENIIEINKLKTRIGKKWVLNGVDLAIKRGEIIGIVGGSGSGKTTLMRHMLHLTKPTSGSVNVFGKNLNTLSQKELLAIQRRWGVLFQQNALFSSLNLLQNVAFPLKEHVRLDLKSRQSLAMLKILMVGLSADEANKYPAELSGGMQKRAGIARAIVLDPELLFLDEPTAGLDPVTAAGFDELTLNLHKTMGLTMIIITHDLDTLWKVTDRVAFLGEGVVLCVDRISELIKNNNPMIQEFFNGPRGRIAAEGYEK